MDNIPIVISLVSLVRREDTLILITHFMFWKEDTVRKTLCKKAVNMKVKRKYLIAEIMQVIVGIITFSLKVF